MEVAVDRVRESVAVDRASLLLEMFDVMTTAESPVANPLEAAEERREWRVLRNLDEAGRERQRRAKEREMRLLDELTKKVERK